MSGDESTVLLTVRREGGWLTAHDEIGHLASVRDHGNGVKLDPTDLVTLIQRAADILNHNVTTTTTIGRD